MKKVGALLLGGLASGILYMIGVAVCEHLVRTSGRSPESYLWLAFLVFAPVACVVGGGVTGILAGPSSRRPVVEAVLLSPGLYIGVPGLLFSFAGATLEFALSMIVPVVLWISASAIGFLAVRKLRERGA